MKYYGAADIFNPLHKMKGKTITAKFTHDHMKLVDCFPIKECLMNRNEDRNFNL